MHFVGGLCYDLNAISYLKTYASVREEDDLTATFLKSSKVRPQREFLKKVSWHQVLRCDAKKVHMKIYICFLLKNPQFLPNHYKTLSKWGPHSIWSTLSDRPNESSERVANNNVQRTKTLEQIFPEFSKVPPNGKGRG